MKIDKIQQNWRTYFQYKSKFQNKSYNNDFNVYNLNNNTKKHILRQKSDTEPKKSCR